MSEDLRKRVGLKNRSGLQRRRLSTLDQLGGGFTSVRHECRHIDEPDHVGRVARFCDNHAPIEWPTSRVAPSCLDRIRLTAVTSSASEVKGFCTTLRL